MSCFSATQQRLVRVVDASLGATAAGGSRGGGLEVEDGIRTVKETNEQQKKMASMNSPCYTVAMDLGVCQLRNFSISFLSSLLSAESSHVKLDKSSSGASVVAIDNKIEQAMDLVKSHLMYAVREEVEVLKEQIKELIERNSQLEQENTLLKTLASPEQMAQFQAQVQTGSPPAPPTVAATPGPPSNAALAQPPSSHSSGPSA